MILQKQNRFFRFLSSWRMQTQILFINTIILLFIVPLIIGVQQINSNLLASYIQETQISLLSLQNQKHLENVILEYEHQIIMFYKRSKINKLLHYKAELTLSSIDVLYKFVKENTFSINQQPKMCYLANDEDIYPQDKDYPIFCVTMFNLEYSPIFPTDSKYKTKANLVLLMDEVIFENDITQRFLPDNFYLAFDDAEEFSAWWPQWVRNSDYHPQQRPWYIQHKEKYLKDNSQISQVSDLYEYYTDKPVVAMTATYTITTNGTFEGVMGSDIELLNEYFEEKDLNIMLMDLDGTLILTNYKNNKISNSTSSYKFYDELVTGFNQEDWNQIQLYLQKEVFVSNCRKFKNFVDSKSLCRFNQLYQRDVQFSIKNMTFPNYILLVFNDMEASIEQEQKAALYLNELNGLFFTIFSIFIIVTISLLILQSICVWFLFRPLYQLIMHSKIYIKANSNKYLFRQKEYYPQSLSMSTNFGANVLQLLKQSYQNIYNRISNQSQRKNIQCQIIQLYQYPKKQIQSHISIQELPLYSDNYKKTKILRIIQDSYLNSVENVI